MDLLNLFNIISFVVFVVLASLITVRISIRYTKFKLLGYSIPTLLKRDLLLFVALVFYFGTALTVLLLHIEGLAREPLWVIPRTLFVLISMGYWAIVEYSLEDNIDK